MLRRAWASIREEYGRLSGNDDHARALALDKDIVSDTIKLNIIRGCLSVLASGHSEAALKALAGIGYRYPVGNNLPAWIDQVARKAKMIEIEIENKRKQQASLAQGGAAKPGRQDFISSLVTLSRFAGYRVDPRRVTVTEYISIKEQFEKEIEVLKNRSKKK